MDNRIQIEINQLYCISSDLNNQVVHILNDVKKLYGLLLQMDDLWSGNAKRTFVSSFKIDLSNLDEAVKVLCKISEDIEYALKVYSNAYQNTIETVNLL